MNIEKVFLFLVAAAVLATATFIKIPTFAKGLLLFGAIILMALAFKHAIAGDNQ